MNKVKKPLQSNDLNDDTIYYFDSFTNKNYLYHHPDGYIIAFSKNKFHEINYNCVLTEVDITDKCTVNGNKIYFIKDKITNTKDIVASIYGRYKFILDHENSRFSIKKPL